MIEVTFHIISILYLGLTLFAILGIWIYSHYRIQKKSFFPTKQTLFICEYCHFFYVKDSDKYLNQCPQCGLFNKNNAYQNKKNN